MKTYVTTLGCPKNLVDTEASISLLRGAGCTMTSDPDKADLMIVSACSFLEASWQETVEEVRRLGEYKQKDSSKKLVLMGCLPKHHGGNWRAGLPQVDRFVRAGEHSQLPAVVRELRGARPSGRFECEADRPGKDPFAGFESRTLLTPGHTAYVKIAEGCSRRCSFCAIPRIRGRMISRDVASVVREVETLHERGVKEVSLLAQDITSFNSGGARFTDLVTAIADTGIEWIRIFYAHPGSLSLDLVRRLFEHPAVCRYLEAPIQHASDRVLKRMRRSYTRARLDKLFTSIYEEFPDVRIRSEVIVGFPGESDDDFDELKTFLEATEFSSLGVFSYSAEANTAAARSDGQVPEATKAERAAELADLQSAISFGRHNAERGVVHRILVDRREPAAGDGYAYAGRYYGQAPEVDGEVLLKGDRLTIGEFVNARITDGDVFDLRGEVA